MYFQRVKASGVEHLSITGPAIFYGAVLYLGEHPHLNIKEHMPNDGDLVDLLALYGEEGSIHKNLVDNPTKLYWND